MLSPKELQHIISPEQVNQHQELLRDLWEEKLSPSTIGLKPRWMTYWEQEGILDKPKDKGERRKFNYFDYVWIKIVMELRKFHVPLNTIKAVKAQIAQPEKITDKIQEVAQNIKQNKDLRKLFDSLVPENIRPGFEDFFFNAQNYEWVNEKISYTNLLLFVMDGIIFKQHLAILVNHEGEVFPFKELYIQDYLNDPKFKAFIQHTYVSISVSHIISQYLKEEKQSRNYKHTILTQEELEVIDIIRGEKLKTLRIRFNDKQEIDLIEATTQTKIDNEARFIDVIMKNGYQYIEIKTEKGKIVSVENTRKYKPKKT